MDEIRTNPVEEDSAMSPETPEDVAVLYTWANVHGGKYRDFSASRREYRAQQRHRMVEAQRQAELEAARSLEEMAARELEEARREEAEAFAESGDGQRHAEAEEARKLAEGRVEQERLAAQRHVETAEELKDALEQAQREMQEARRRAEEQAARYAEADKRWRDSQGQRDFVPGATEDPYYFAGHLEPGAFAPGKGVRSSVPQRVSSESRIAASYRSREREHPESGEYRAAVRQSDNVRPVYEVRDVDSRSHETEQRIETPEDTLERNRLDERQRRDGQASAFAYDDRGNSSYYDRMPLLGEPRTSDSASTRNSAQSDLHIPPRVQQTRTGQDSGIRPSVVPAALPEDHDGTNHTLESRRRWDSSTDLSTRTERRPRLSEAAPLETEAGLANAQGGGEAAATNELRRDGRDYRAPERESYPSRDTSPEWLVRSRPAEDAARERLRADARNIALAAQQRLDEQQRRLDEERRAMERAHAEEERRMAEEDHRIAEARMRAEGRRHVEDVGRRPPNDERYRNEQERLRAEEQRRGDEAAREQRAEEGPSRDSQIVRAADGGVNLRPLSDRGPLLSSLPPLRERPQLSFLGDRVSGGVTKPATDLPVPVAPVPIQVDQSLTSPAAETAVPLPRQSAPTPADTLQQSRERVAARWFALKGLMDAGSEQNTEPLQPAVRPSDLSTPCLAIVSLSGGVGKTSLVATVGRALSSVGERVLLADTTTHGLLPYYFGARELRPDVVRTFSPPPGSADAPVYMVNYETDRLNGDEVKQQAMVEEMMRQARGVGRVLLDLNGSSVWLARLLTRSHSNILVPIAPDMNSVLSIQSVDRFFSGSTDSDGRPVAPYYVLNQFDASLPLHLDVREVLRQQLGNRLLPVMIRRSPAVSEALAEGMTVIDYAPESPVTDDYKSLAEWVRKLAAPATTGLRSIRWSEQ